MFAVDLHAHVGFLHVTRGRPTPLDPLGLRLLAGVARFTHLDGVAVTNHDFHEDHPESVFGVGIVPGIEVSTTRGHVLVLGPDPPARTTPGELTPQETVDLAHSRGCAAVIAHPFRNSSVREVDADFDAIELDGKRPWDRPKIEAIARERDLPIVGGSDAHLSFQVGRAYTLVDAEECTPASIVAAIRDGRVEARVRHTPIDRAIRAIYDRIHRLRGHTGESE